MNESSGRGISFAVKSGNRSKRRTTSYPIKPTSPPVSGGNPAILGDFKCAAESLSASSGSIPVGAPAGVVPCQ